MASKWCSGITRRQLLASGAIFVAAGAARPAFGRNYAGGVLPWEPSATARPVPVRPGPWLYFTADEAGAVEAIVDRLIPPGEGGPGAKQAGCAVFIDRQLEGACLYMRPPFANGTPSQRLQSSILPKERYRTSLTALDAHCRTRFAVKGVAALDTAQQDQILRGIEGILALRNGDMDVVRGGGPAFTDEVLSELVVSTRVLGTKEIMLLNHTGRGFTTFTDEEPDAKLAVTPRLSPCAFFPTRTLRRTPGRRAAKSGRIRGLPRMSPFEDSFSMWRAVGSGESSWMSGAASSLKICGGGLHSRYTCPRWIPNALGR